MSNSYNTQNTELFPNTKVFTGVVLQHRGKILLLHFPSYRNKKKYAKYEIMILYFVIFERFYPGPDPGRCNRSKCIGQKKIADAFIGQIFTANDKKQHFLRKHKAYNAQISTK